MIEEGRSGEGAEDEGVSRGGKRGGMMGTTPVEEMEFVGRVKRSVGWDLEDDMRRCFC